MSGALRVLLFVVVGYYLIKWIGRLVAPWLMKKAAQKMQAQAQAQQQYHTDGRKEGDIRVEYPNQSDSPNSRPSSSGEGEYIDFEEIKE